MASRSSSELRASACRRAPLVALAVWLVLSTIAGCVTVRPEERELLADPAMTFGAGGEVEAQEAHVLSNREGSYGASGVTGGGCGCN